MKQEFHKNTVNRETYKLSEKLRANITDEYVNYFVIYLLNCN